MDVNNMVAAMAAKTVDAMVNVEPYNVIAVAEGIGTRSWIFPVSTRCRSSWRRRPISWRRAPTPSSLISRPGTTSAAISRTIPTKGRRRDLPFYAVKGYNMSLGHLRQGAGARRGRSRLSRRSCSPTCRSRRRSCCAEKKIYAIPDWKKALRPGFYGKRPRRIVSELRDKNEADLTRCA